MVMSSISFFISQNKTAKKYFLIRQGPAVHMCVPIYRHISDAAVIVSGSFSV